MIDDVQSPSFMYNLSQSNICPPSHHQCEPVAPRIGKLSQEALVCCGGYVVSSGSVAQLQQNVRKLKFNINWLSSIFLITSHLFGNQSHPFRFCIPQRGAAHKLVHTNAISVFSSPSPRSCHSCSPVARTTSRATWCNSHSPMFWI